jgi:Fuc2NAc and GlcNAc transferase
MGDVGSGFLGVVLGIIASIAIVMEFVPFWSWLILFAVFIVDATITLLRRIFRGDRWYEAHCTHAYQHAAREYGHLKVTLFVNIINWLWIFPLAYLAFYYPKWGALTAILALTPLIILALKYNAGLPEKEPENPSTYPI